MSLIGKTVMVRTCDWNSFEGTLIGFIPEHELVQLQLETGLMLIPLRNVSYIREGEITEPVYSAGTYPDMKFKPTGNNKNSNNSGQLFKEDPSK